MKPIIIIPARGGSKGIPNKNIKLLGGKPLIQFTIEAALQIADKDKIIISTDSEEIRKAVESLGINVPFLRPMDLASDTAGTYEVLLYEIGKLERMGTYCDYIILLQPTSPFRTSKHILEAIDLYNSNIDMVVSVKETKSNPYYVLREEDENGFLKPSKRSEFTRRQDVPKVWEINGAIYIINIATLKKMNINKFSKVKKYVMDEFSSHDIDTQLDWVTAENIIKS